MNRLQRFAQGFKHGYRSEQQMRSERTEKIERPKAKRGWREFLEATLMFLLFLAIRYFYRTPDWNLLVQCVAIGLAVIGVLWLSWRLFRPVVMLFIDQGIVGCLRWVRDRVLVPLLYGRRGKQ